MKNNVLEVMKQDLKGSQDAYFEAKEKSRVFHGFFTSVLSFLF